MVPYVCSQWKLSASVETVGMQWWIQRGFRGVAGTPPPPFSTVYFIFMGNFKISWVNYQNEAPFANWNPLSKHPGSAHEMGRLARLYCLCYKYLFHMCKLKWAATWQNQQNDLCVQRTRISLGSRPAWSEFSLSAWRKLGSLATHWAYSEDSNQTWADAHIILLVLSWSGSNIGPKLMGWHIQLSQAMRKCVLCHMQTTKAQISLRIRAVWSAPLFSPLR